ncbi:putative small secreted protein [Geothermobacter ehrlichii]|uniref:Putative small secreted protein n=1 Tax=Geothermobacter ehrlichii TaxID=213224 RepID=A0A5D3WM31_9BACT|nr:hypothetical protein [Geothermobacter ehrlichii]TYO98559.1 putative small secreted protein [Geothermobacter ehrlichii]
MKRLFALLLLLALMTLTGCQCLSGFGRDLQDFGKWIERQSSGSEQ